MDYRAWMVGAVTPAKAGAGHDVEGLMSNLKTLGLAAVMVSLVLTQLHLMTLVQTLFAWFLAAMAFGAAVIWGRIIASEGG